MDKLLIATTRKLILWDGKQNDILEGNFYGLTWDDKNIYISNNPPNSHMSVIEKYTKEFSKLDNVTEVKNGDIHQICFYKEKLYITCPGKSFVRIININTKHIDDMNLDAHMHCNSVYAYKNKIYILDSRSQNGTFRIRIIENNTVIADQSFATGYPSLHHNVLFDKNKIISCYHQTDGSRKNRLIIYDMLKLKFDFFDVKKDKENGFLRGLARNKDHYFIGEFQHENIRSERLMGNSRILVLDNDFKLIDTIELEDTGQIRDIRLLKNDEAHNGINYE